MLKKAESIIEFLLGKGCVEMETATWKHRKFRNPNTQTIYRVGRYGALRVGDTLKDSISLTLPVLERSWKMDARNNAETPDSVTG